MKSRLIILNFSVVLGLLTYYLSPKFSIYSLFITTTNIPFLHLLHILYLCTIFYLITQKIIRYYYGEIRIQEQRVINDNMQLLLSDIFLMLTVFSRDIKFRYIIIYFIIICIKNIQWINTIRSDNLNCNILVFMTCSLMSYIFFGKGNMLFLFSFEFCTISLASLRNIITLKLQEKENKPQLSFLVEISYLFLLFLIYSIFIIITSLRYKIPLNVFRASLNVLEKLFKKTKDFIKYTEICKEIEKIPDSIEEGECIICQDEKPTKKLKCGHVFHLECLKQWSERQHFCPICKVDLYTTSSIVSDSPEEVRGVAVDVFE